MSIGDNLILFILDSLILYINNYIKKGEKIMSKEFHIPEENVTEDMINYLPHLISLVNSPSYGLCERLLLKDPTIIQFILLNEDNPDYNRISELYKFLTL